MNNHKQWVSETFDRAAPLYGKKSSSFFDYFGRRLVEQVNVTPNQCILDVATGKGAVLFPLAEAVGPLGKVVGIDISQQMLKETSKEAHARNIDSIELLCMDAEKLDFPDNSFDFVFCGFGLFFFPSILTALSEFKRVLKAGGSLVVSTWGENSELDKWITEEIKKVGNPRGLITTPLWSGKELRKILEEASFNDIQIIEETKIFSHHSAQEWWDSFWSHATRAKFEQLSSDQLASLHEKALKKANNLDKGQGIAEPLQVFYGIAKKNPSTHCP